MRWVRACVCVTVLFSSQSAVKPALLHHPTLPKGVRRRKIYMYYGMKLPNTHEHRTFHIPNFLLFLLGSWRGEALGVGGGQKDG